MEEVGHMKCECGTVIGYDSLLRQIGAVTCPLCLKRVDIRKEPEDVKREANNETA